MNVRLDWTTGNQNEEALSGRGFRLRLGLLLGAAASCYVALAAASPIFHRAEVYFAESAREMLATGRIITPFYLNQPFFDKPILTYWAILASFRMLGTSHFAARMPSVLAALATTALIGYGVSRVWSRTAGLVAAAALCSSYMFVYDASLSMSDMLLTLFCTAAGVLLFAGSRDAPRRTRDWCLASLFMALGVLTKGPVAVVLPVGAFLLYLALRRELGQIRVGHAVAGAAIVLAVAGSWFALLWRQNGTVALFDFFMKENLERFTGAAYAIRRPFGFAPLALLGDFLPWALFLPGAFGASARERIWRGDSARRCGELFAWCWVGFVTLFFWVSRGEMDYYLLPALPACAVLVGGYLSRPAERGSILLRAAGWVLGAILLLTGVAAGSFVLFAGRSGLRPLWPVALWLVLSGAAVVTLLVRRKYMLFVAAVCLVVLGGGILGAWIGLPTYRQAVSLGDAVKAAERGHANMPLAISADLDHWRAELAFRTGTVPSRLGTPEAFAEFLRDTSSSTGPRLAVVGDDWVARLPRDVAGRAAVVRRERVLTTGVTLASFLRASPGASRAMKSFAVLYCKTGRGLDSPSLPASPKP
jgi:4-amino-4-deoxy-L-arabinose transferase-like glycosyltransferase